MAYNFKYMPALRSRQQELLVLSSFEFGDRIFPLLEIIKLKDRSNNAKAPQDIWLDYIKNTNAVKVFVDLPVYIKDSTSMSDEVLHFNRTVLSNIEARVDFFNHLVPQRPRVIPVVSSLYLKTGKENTIKYQFTELRKNFDSIAIRTFTNTIDNDLAEINEMLSENDVLIYDLDTVQPYNPLVRKQKSLIAKIDKPYKVILRSAINTEIQNTKLEHGGIVADADNSLLDVFESMLNMNAFGDYAGIKKDDLNAGGTISPGFIFYDPIDNLYYGYKGEFKELSEFENTIVPAVLDSEVVRQMKARNSAFLIGNEGYKTLRAISRGEESGKSQAKFKRIAMEHYLHTIKTRIEAGEWP